MEQLLTSLPYTNIVTALVVVILGMASGFYFFDRDRRSRRLEEKEADSRLVNILQTTVKELDKKVKKQGEKMDELTKEVDTLKHENETLIKVLQGRDEATQEFQRRVLESITISEQTHQLVVKVAEGLTKANETMVKMISLIEARY